MKKYILVSFIALMSVAHAQNLPAGVLAQHAVHVGFAPREMVGTYKLQLLTNGTIQKIDNKNVKTVVGSLSKAIVAKFQKGIQAIKSDELTIPQDPPCMDAPAEDIQVRQTSGKTLTVWKRGGCLESTAIDSFASASAQVMVNLEETFSTIEYLRNLTDEN